MDVGALLQHTQYAIPIGIVLACAILVFVFGFKNAEQPPFAQLTSGSDVDRKPAGKKRNKIKEKVRTGNGLPVTVEKSSPAKKLTPVKVETVKKTAAKVEELGTELKELKNDENKPVIKKDKTVGAPKSGKENKVELTKNRKNLKNNSQEKPVDFDDGDWEPAYSRKEKKNKKKDDEIAPKRSKKEAKKSAELISKTSRNEKGQAKAEVKDKVAKDTENKELKEKNNKELVFAPVTDVQLSGEDSADKEENGEVQIEKVQKSVIKEESEKAEQVDETEKVEKTEKTEKTEKKSAKAKKTKKVIDAASNAVVSTSELPSPEKSEEKGDKPAEEEKKINSETTAERKMEKVEQNNTVAFDELGDVWTEAKPQKKSKKKARKDY